MIEVKITGSDVKDVFTQFAHTFMLLAQGGNKLFTPQANPAPTPNATPAPVIVTPSVPAFAAEVVKLVVEKKKRARPGIEAPPLPEGGDPVPDLTLPANLDRAKSPTAVEVKARTVAIIQKFEEAAYAKTGKPRADADQATSDAVMNDTMKFMLPIFKPFGVKSSRDLKPEQFVEYMAATAQYL